MKISIVTRNLLVKIPTLLLIMIVLYALAFNRNSFLGNPLSVVDSSSRANLMSGYAGPVSVIVTLDSLSRVLSVQVGENSETPRFLDRVINSGLLASWNKLPLDQAIAAPVNAVSGATMSSRAIIANTRAEFERLSTLSVNRNSVGESVNISAGQWAALVVVLLSLLCYFMPARTRSIRIWVLVLSIAVLGVWQGAFVSLDLLYGWLLHSPTWSYIVLSVVVVLALVLPLIFSKSYYCNYVCPFGAAQEVISKIPLPKVRLTGRMVKWLSWIKRIVLALFVILLFINQNFIPSEWEPFSIFMINMASVSVIVIASLSLLLSIFVPKAYCRFVCPTGQLLSILQKGVSTIHFKRR